MGNGASGRATARAKEIPVVAHAPALARARISNATARTIKSLAAGVVATTAGTAGTRGTVTLVSMVTVVTISTTTGVSGTRGRRARVLEVSRVADRAELWDTALAERRRRRKSVSIKGTKAILTMTTAGASIPC